MAAATVAPSARDAVDGADVVVSAAAFLPPAERQTMTNAWLSPDALVVPIDYATYCAAEVARDAALFVVDHRDQFLANRDAGQFDGYPDPVAMMGEVLARGEPRPRGRVRGDAPRHRPRRRGVRRRHPRGGRRDGAWPGAAAMTALVAEKEPTSS